MATRHYAAAAAAPKSGTAIFTNGRPKAAIALNARCGKGKTADKGRTVKRSRERNKENRRHVEAWGWSATSGWTDGWGKTVGDPWPIFPCRIVSVRRANTCGGTIFVRCYIIGPGAIGRRERGHCCH